MALPAAVIPILAPVVTTLRATALGGLGSGLVKLGKGKENEDGKPSLLSSHLGFAGGGLGIL